MSTSTIGTPVKLVNPPARSSGFFWLTNFALGPAMIAVRQLVHLNDAALTSSNILAHSTLFLLGFAGNVVSVVGYLVVTALWYRLFRPVNANLATVAAFIGGAACVILGIGTVCYVSPLAILTGVTSGPALQQAQAFAIVLIKLYGQCYNTSLIFFALYGVLTGYLAYRSTFLPRFLGIGFMVAGFGWLAFIWPPLAKVLYPYVLVTGLGEGVFAFWLMIKGVNLDRWREEAFR
jgi:hypothetical protein